MVSTADGDETTEQRQRRLFGALLRLHERGIMHAFQGRTRKTNASWRRAIGRYQSSMRGGYMNTALLFAVGFTEADVAAIDAGRRYIVATNIRRHRGQLASIRFIDEKMWPSFRAALRT